MEVKLAESSRHREDRQFICQIRGAQRAIPVRIERRKRKTVGISVKHPGEVVLYWPERHPLYGWQSVLEGKRLWLERHLSALEDRIERQASLRLEASEGLWLLGSPAHIDLPDGLTKQQRETALALIFERISEWFLTARFDVLYEQALADERFTFKVPFAGLKLRTAGTRWGSCTSKGNIMLNRRLFGAPIWVIDYVIWHELCHLVYLNHSKDFWSLCHRHCPRTSEARQWLRAHQELMLAQC